MNKTIFSILFILTSTVMHSQVGINTSSPNATLDVVKNTTAPTSAKDGIIPPKVSKLELSSKVTNTYSTLQIGAIVFIDNISGTLGTESSIAQVAQIDAVGYYYFDGTIWRKLVTATGGDITNDAWINGSSRVELGTTSVGLARVTGSEVVIDDNGNVGIGTKSPTNKLEINKSGVNDTGLKLTVGAASGLKLISDANGNARWNSDYIKYGTVPSTGVNIPEFSKQYYTGAEITLTTGRWIVEFGAYAGLANVTGTSPNFTFANTSATAGATGAVIDTDSTIWCTCSLSSTETSYTSLSVADNGLIEGSGKAGANNMARGTRSMQMQGKMLLNVTDASKKYYMFVICNNFGAIINNYRPYNIFGPGWERWFFATPL